VQRVINHLKDLTILESFSVSDKISVIIGNFDGVHQGHQEILKKIKQECLISGNKLVVMSFNPHPSIILRDQKSYLLCSYQQKYEFLLAIGVDAIVEIRFNRDFSSLSPEQFLQNHIFCGPQVNHIYLGHDFHFGKNKSGGIDEVADFLKKNKLESSVQVTRLNLYKVKDKLVSSSIIRNHLLKSEIKEANHLLGRKFSIEGIVVRGLGRGRLIGFPTANIETDSGLIIPSNGVYETNVLVKGLEYKSLSNIGRNPTFENENHIHFETHLLNFDYDIYGERIKVSFEQFIRPEKKFSNANALVEQIEKDVSSVRSRMLNES